MSKNYYTVEDLIQTLGIGRTTAYALVKRLNHTRIGRRILISEEDLQSYLSRNTEIRENPKNIKKQ
ncbi:MAG: helix-turn-helix domain-containing protein [Clostridia bacterium]|nr:helix-turn-helix domain-containing protein [Clostridia bacterium]